MTDRSVWPRSPGDLVGTSGQAHRSGSAAAPPDARPSARRCARGSARGASFWSWRSSMISAPRMPAASAAKRVISTAPIAKLGATSTFGAPSAAAPCAAARPGNRSSRSRRARRRRRPARRPATSGAKSTTTPASAAPRPARRRAAGPRDHQARRPAPSTAHTPHPMCPAAGPRPRSRAGQPRRRPRRWRRCGPGGGAAVARKRPSSGPPCDRQAHRRMPARRPARADPGS